MSKRCFPVMTMITARLLIEVTPPRMAESKKSPSNQYPGRPASGSRDFWCWACGTRSTLRGIGSVLEVPRRITRSSRPTFACFPTSYQRSRDTRSCLELPWPSSLPTLSSKCTVVLSLIMSIMETYCPSAKHRHHPRDRKPRPLPYGPLPTVSQYEPGPLGEPEAHTRRTDMNGTRYLSMRNRSARWKNLWARFSIIGNPIYGGSQP